MIQFILLVKHKFELVKDIILNYKIIKVCELQSAKVGLNEI